MRSSAVLVFSVLATAAPAFGAPVAVPYARDTASAPPPTSSTPPPTGTATTAESAALSLGTIGTIFSLAAPVISDIIEQLKSSGSQQQRRDASELEELFARATAQADESGALKLPSLKTLGNIASLGLSGLGILGSLLPSEDNSQQQRDFIELLSRAEVDESGALSLGDAAAIASIGSSIVSAFHNIFGSNNRRELLDILARADSEVDESGALSLGTISTIFSVAAPVINGIIDHFENNGSSQQRRDAQVLGKLFARATAEVDESGALKLPSLSTLGSLASLGLSGLGILGGLFPSDSTNQQQRRELLDLLSRTDADAETDESGAISFSTIGNIGSIAGSAISILHNLFGGSSDDSNQQRRELIDLLSRADVDESGALKLPSLEDSANGASIASSVVSILHNLFGGSSSDNSQQRRELIELLSRAEVDESEALKLPSLKDSADGASIASSVVSILHNLFGGSSDDSSQQRREFIELLSRAEVDESGAFKLPSLEDSANGASIASSVVSILHNLFGGDSQQQRRENSDSLTRTDATTPLSLSTDESGALSLGSIASIASIGIPIISGIINHFTGGDQQQRREVLNLLTRDAVTTTASTSPLTTDESGALSLGSIASIASIGIPIISGIIDHFTGGNQQQRREVLDLLARDATTDTISTIPLTTDESGALSLSSIASIASIGIPIISGIIDHFTGDNSQQRREFIDLLARTPSLPVARSLNDLD